ncbi:MAG: diphthine synthase [Candidatus Woesearchaeota archaeon]
MTLNIIGIGLNDEKDITLKGLELIQNSDYVYLENYTSKLNCPIENLEKLYKKKIILADRNLVENKTDEILNQAKTKNVSLLIIGDPFSATTHITLLLKAKEMKIKTQIINNASILTAMGITGLELYKFGKTTSIPFNHKNIKTPIEALKNNQKINLHTLFLLDLNPKENKFLTINEAAKYLIENKVKKETLAIGLTQLGSDNPEIKTSSLENLTKLKFNKYPQSLIIPGKLHFIEEEAITRFKK